MRAVVLAGVGDVRVEEVADPQVLESTDAIVRVNAAAICGADLFPLHGMTPGFENGTVMGHEFAGVVVETGNEVGGVEVGQRVVNTSMVADGSCPASRAGRSPQC
jgi:threonine dehydrogenase-like Zn-dependent dehydrogenase